MKVYLITLIVLASFVWPTSVANAVTYVSGYTRSNGTYVAPHVRSNQNGLKSDNYSYKGGAVYNSTYGTRGSSWDTPTYITDPDYYIGKSIYDGRNSSSKYSYNSYMPSYSTNSSSYATDNSANYRTYESVVGGYKNFGVLFCSVGYYISGDSCLKAPDNSTAYGNSTFYCDFGYEKAGNSCQEKMRSQYSYLSKDNIASNKKVESNGDFSCDSGYTRYDGRCVLAVANASFNGSGYTCNNDFFADSTGKRCVGIDSVCKSRHGISTYGVNGQCHCNYGAKLDTISNQCLF